ncbi:MAG: hypothetical protein KDN22_27330 [Verrucomicrobiae bacterium]|nr:hypothetical protein [Verrucomicrobiae bacterium]
MDPEDIHKGRIYTWSVLVTECFIGLIVMMVLAKADPGTFLSAEEQKALAPDILEMARADWKQSLSATNTANVGGPIYFVLITGFSLALLGGNWGVRLAYGGFLLLLALVTGAAPWISPHRAVLEPSTVAIICCSLFALLHAVGGVIMLFFKPVQLFLHPRRMLFSAPPQMR